MKGRAWLALVLIALLLAAIPLGQAWAWGGGGHGGHGGSGHFHGRVFVGTSFWWPPYYYPYPYYYYPYPYTVYPPAPVIVDQPVYSQQAQPAPESYWYYCASAQGYYPTVPSCQEAWIKVPPRTE
jgi:hypothetical protein